MVEWLNPQPGWRVLDVAGGTGDIAFRIVEHGARAAAAKPRSRSATSMPRCWARAGAAPRRKARARIEWVCGDAEKLPFPDAHFDAYTIAFGIRNVTHIDAALREARRVLKPGGRFLCLEFSKVEVPGLDTLYDAYSFKLLPKIGGLVAGDEESYRYLAESIRRFPPQAKFARMIARGRPRTRSRCAICPAASPPCIRPGASDERCAACCACGNPRAACRYDALLPGDIAPAAWRARVRGDLAGARSGRPARGWRMRWSGWVPPISSWARCWRRGPILWARMWPRALEHLQDRLPPFSECGARRRSPTAFGEPVEALFSSFGAPRGGRLHRPGASRHHTSEGAGRVRSKCCAPGSRRCSRRDLEALALFARAGGALFRGSAAAAFHRRWWRRWRPRWRWSSICGWRRRRLPNSTSAPAATRNSACRMSTGPAPRPGC